MIKAIFAFLQSFFSTFFALAPSFTIFCLSATNFNLSAFFFAGDFAALIAFFKAAIFAATFFFLIAILAAGLAFAAIFSLELQFSFLSCATFFFRIFFCSWSLGCLD